MAYTDYDFCLYWEDLPEDFRSEKIDEVIKKKLDNGDYNIECLDDETGMKIPRLNKVLENEDIRYEVEKWITVHFPMYF